MENQQSKNKQMDVNNNEMKMIGNHYSFGQNVKMKFGIENSNQRKASPLGFNMKNNLGQNLKIEEQNESKNDSEENKISNRDNFISFGTVKTSKIKSDLKKVTIKLETNIKDIILLNALTVIDSHRLLVTAGSSDKTIRIWSITNTELDKISLKLIYESQFFEKPPTNLFYIAEKKYLFAGDQIHLFVFCMSDILKNHSNSPKLIKTFSNIHWAKCIYPFKSNNQHFIITAYKNKVFYTDLNSLKTVYTSTHFQFNGRLMCFEPISDSIIAVADSEEICFWHIHQRECVGERRKDHSKVINHILNIENKNNILTGGDDGFIFNYSIKNKNDPKLSLLQKITPSNSKIRSFIDSFIYFPDQSLILSTNRTKCITIFALKRNELLEEKTQIEDLKFKATGLYLWKKEMSLIVYSSSKDQIVIYGLDNFKK